MLGALAGILVNPLFFLIAFNFYKLLSNGSIIGFGRPSLLMVLANIHDSNFSKDDL